jgi:gliding motility-associated-like protein
MKLNFTNLFKGLAVVGIALFTFSQAGAQQNIASKQYRVTAFKNGDNSIQSVSNYATVVPAVNIYVPNAFTPNSDDINEKFGVTGQGIGQFNMKIYNAWGEKIFESNKPEEGWDGKFKGANSPVGTYLYIVVAKGVSGKNVYRNGNFVLLK